MFSHRRGDLDKVCPSARLQFLQNVMNPVRAVHRMREVIRRQHKSLSAESTERGAEAASRPFLAGNPQS
jgi:hypothetical protein